MRRSLRSLCLSRGRICRLEDMRESQGERIRSRRHCIRIRACSIGCIWYETSVREGEGKERAVESKGVGGNDWLNKCQSKSALCCRKPKNRQHSQPVQYVSRIHLEIDSQSRRKHSQDRIHLAMACKRGMRQEPMRRVAGGM
jgi:hypothetical protein